MTAAMHCPVRPREIWPQLAVIGRRIAAAERLFLFLDFDGTLAPIAALPSLAVMPEVLHDILADLCARPDVVVAVISGRSLEDLRQRVDLPVILAGNHGLEIEGGGLRFSTPCPPHLESQLNECCRALRPCLERFSGVWIEGKRLSAAVHVRQALRRNVPLVDAVVRDAAACYPDLVVSGGKEVIEIRPKVAWNKGLAARWILGELRGEVAGAVCMGDDATDEDIFRELSGAVTVRVGHNADSAAAYWIEESEVLRFFLFLRKAVRHWRPAGADVSKARLEIGRYS